MKIFLFNREKWETRGAVAIIAESIEKAEELYKSEFDFDKYEIEEFEIKEHLMLIADGYDTTSIYAKQL